MASLRRLRRRLLRWERYADQVGGNFSPREFRGRQRSGYWRAFEAVYGEEELFWAQTPEIWMGGPAGEAALLADVLGDDTRCCDAGDDGHLGPCATTCLSCGGAGRCPECGGVDDLGCNECDGSGSCPECWGQGEHVEDVYVGPRAVTLAVDRGLL